MTVQEAAKLSKYSEFMICKFAREGRFVACKPRGSRNGWEINEVSFRKWYSFQRFQGSNAYARHGSEYRSPQQKIIALLEDQTAILLRIEVALASRARP